MYNPFENGVEVQKLSAVDGCSHRTTTVGVARVLQEAHIPFGVVTNISLDQLNRYRAVILPWVVELTAAQAEAFRKFVADGGVLYASGPSSVDRLMAPTPRFLLEDVLGVRYKGKLKQGNNLHLTLLTALLSLLAPALTLAGPRDINRVINPGFEDNADGRARGWSRYGEGY